MRPFLPTLNQEMELPSITRIQKTLQKGYIKMSQGMHPEEIKAALRKSGKTLEKLSKEWGFCASAVSKALRSPMPRVEPKIAKYIGVPLYKIWPDRYDRDNIRIFPFRNGKKAISTLRQSHSQKQQKEAVL